jgi:hypothetical protein
MCYFRVILRDLVALVPQIFHSLHKIAFPNVLHRYKIFSNFDKKKFLQTLNEVMNFINNKLLLC